jgi:hypothetical protein
MKKALSLTALSALLKKSGSVDHKTFHTYKKLKTYSQGKKYAENKYLERAYKSWNVNPTAHRSVQALKKSLKNYPDIQKMNHPYHFGMPLENKQVYTAKRAETLRRLSQAKMHRASQKLKGSLHPSKRSKLENRLSRMKEKSRKM